MKRGGVKMTPNFNRENDMQDVIKNITDAYEKRIEVLNERIRRLKNVIEKLYIDDPEE
jgi:hypothetical protein